MEEKIKLRDEIDNEYKWDLTKVYRKYSDVLNDMKIVEDKTSEFLKYEGHILDSADILLEAIEKQYEIIRIMDKLVVYSNMKFHEDMSISSNQALISKIDSLSDMIFSHIAFFTPEILKCDYSLIEKYMNDNYQLKKYEFILKELFRTKDHTLDKEKEKLLASLGEIFSNFSDTFDMIDDVDLKFDSIKNENGNVVELNNSTYSKYIKSNDRNVRKNAFISLYKGYDSLKNTIFSTFKGNLKVDTFVAKTRGYNSPIEMGLDNENIDVKLYDKLISSVNDKLNVLQDYVKLRKEILGYDDLHMYDLYVPLINDIDKKYSYEEGKNIVLNALSVLGKDYNKNLNSLFDSKCIDVYNNKNKRGGAYSWGSYDTLPYVLLNYSGTFNDVSTIAHELGHSMHSYYSHKNQDYHNGSYTIFLAEIASTVNEILLNRYCYLNSNKKEEKLYYLNNLLEQIRTTLYRQTLFAEFEKIVHEKTFNNEVLTEEEVSEIYYDLNKKYYGDDIVCDEQIKLEWSRIPHFYNSFYVYKYSTGIAIACRIASDILSGKDGALDNYIKFLSSGGSDYSLNILKKVGIDIVNDDTIDKALEMFSDTLEEFKKLI